jgi:imidazolonepropionase-like amidohydrolase
MAAPTARTGQTVAPSTITCHTHVGAPGIGAGSQSNVAAASIQSTVTIGTPTVGAGSGITPDTISGTTVTGDPVLAAAIALSPPTISGYTAIYGAATVGYGTRDVDVVVTVGPRRTATAVGARSISVGSGPQRSRSVVAGTRDVSASAGARGWSVVVEEQNG